MMYRWKSSLFILLFGIGSLAASEIEIGMRMANNRWNGHWTMTPVPAIAWSTNWFRLEAEGTTGSASTSSGLKDYSLRTQWSIVPMLRIPLGEYFFATAGYGFSSVFRREELFQEGIFSYSSHTENKGVLRTLAGLRYPVTNGLHLSLYGGYSSMNSKNNDIFGALALEFSLDREETETMIAAPSKPAQIVLSPESTIRKLTIVRPRDPVVNDLITSVEEGLLQAGIEVISWEKLKNLLTQQVDNSEKTSTQNYSALTKDDVDLNVAFTAAQIQDLDAILEVRMRYAFESYGGDIEVSAMSARAIQPVTGRILWVLDDDEMKMVFSRAKKQFITDILKVMQTSLR